MKLYTEKQVHSAILLALGMYGIYIPNKHYQYLIDLLTHLELPSDEEIDNKLDLIDKYHIMKDFYCDGFKDGAKMVINKIQGGNNEQQ